MNFTWRKIKAVLPYMILVIWLVLIHTRLLAGAERAKVTQAYQRTTNCFAAHNPNERDNDLIIRCYTQAESDSGSGPIKHYNDIE